VTAESLDLEVTGATEADEVVERVGVGGIVERSNRLDVVDVRIPAEHGSARPAALARVLVSVERAVASARPPRTVSLVSIATIVPVGIV